MSNAATATKATPTKAAGEQETSSTEVKTAALTAVPERKVQPIEEARIKSGDFVRSFYMATAFENTEPTDLLKPEYWAHFAQKLRLRDRIEVWANDGSWIADVVVMGATKNSADVRVLRVDYLDNVRPVGDLPEGLKSYEVRYRGIHSQWSVIRVADNAVVHEGEGSRTAADNWLANHLKAFK